MHLKNFDVIYYDVQGKAYLVPIFGPWTTHLPKDRTVFLPFLFTMLAHIEAPCCQWPFGNQ
ncbi:MAG: hypothetical protein ABI380_06505 [Edaphobacter sp.]